MNSLCYFVLIATCLTLGQAKSCNYYDGPKANASFDVGRVVNCNEPRTQIPGNHKCFLLEYYKELEPHIPRIERGCVYEQVLDTFCSTAREDELVKRQKITGCRICENDCTSGSTTLAGFYQAMFALILLRCYTSKFY